MVVGMLFVESSLTQETVIATAESVGSVEIGGSLGSVDRLEIGGSLGSVG